jgi:tRNA pseudouridine38-40 synthase
MRNIAVRLAYDGTSFVGSQWQLHGRSVQGEVEAAWTQLTQESPRFTFAGRTDAGVHAQGQVANVHTNTHHNCAVVQRALNAILPHDIAVLDVWEAPPGFHARKGASQRWYRYLVDTGAVALPMLRLYAVHVPLSLDVERMQQALRVLHGQHDFAAFAKVSHDNRSTVRTCYQAQCHMVEYYQRPLLAIDIVANGFLHHMVRNVVGTLLLVGQGHLSAGAFEQILNERDRRQAGPTAAAHGLTLMAVGYPEDAT